MLGFESMTRSYGAQKIQIQVGMWLVFSTMYCATEWLAFMALGMVRRRRKIRGMIMRLLCNESVVASRSPFRAFSKAVYCREQEPFQGVQQGGLLLLGLLLALVLLEDDLIEAGIGEPELRVAPVHFRDGAA